MSITYPEVSSSTTVKRATGASVMNSGSALFPTGATSVYERAAKARKGGNTPLAWIAAPVAVVLIGGAVYLSATHQNAAPPAPAVKTVTTRSVTPAIAPAPSPRVQAAAPAAAATTQATHVQTSVKTTGPAIRANPAPRVTHTTTVSNSVPAPPPAVPAAVIPAPAQASPTPGTFAFTPAVPAASAVTTTPDTVTPPAASAPAPSPDAQASPQI